MGAFGQSKSIGDPMGPVNVTSVAEYRRVINFAKPDAMTALVSRATGTTHPPMVPGGPLPTPGTLNQTITAAQAAASWAQALNIWTTPWGFLKGAAANNATVSRQGGQQIVSFSPAGFTSPSGSSYTVTGYITNQNLITKVETRVDHAVVGDLLVEFEYSAYQNMNGVQVPTRIVQRQAGLQTLDATIDSATPNPPTLAELLAPAACRQQHPRAAAQPSSSAPPVERIGDGVFKIGGNYTSLAVDMGDHTLVVESGQSDARGLAVMAAAKQAIPNKPIRFVVNSHPHFDHASGLAAAVAEGATILTHRNNEQVLERLLSGSRTLAGDSLSKVSNRRANVVEGVGKPRRAEGDQRQDRRAASHSERAQRRHARRPVAGREGLVDGGHHGRESQPGSARHRARGRRGAQPAEARLRRVDPGTPAESGPAAHESGRVGGGRCNVALPGADPLRPPIAATAGCDQNSICG